MRDKTKEFISRILQTNKDTTDEEYVALRDELNEYLIELPKDERDEFVRTGFGDMLNMCCP